MSMEWISISECQHGGLYLLDSRNLTLGVYAAQQNGFVGIREKFEIQFLFVENHWDYGPPCGTAKPLRFLEQYPFEDVADGWRTDGGWKQNDTMYSWLKEKELKHGNKG